MRKQSKPRIDAKPSSEIDISVEITDFHAWHRHSWVRLSALAVVAAASVGASYFLWSAPKSIPQPGARPAVLIDTAALSAEVSNITQLWHARKFDAALDALDEAESRELLADHRAILTGLRKRITKDQQVALGQAAFDSGDFVSAMRAAQAVLELEPTHSEARALLSQSRRMLSEHASGTVQTFLPVYVHSEPPAQLYVDRRHVGMTPTEMRVTPGIHSIELLREGYHSLVREVTVQRGPPQELRFQLVPVVPGVRPPAVEIAPPVYEGVSEAGSEGAVGQRVQAQANETRPPVAPARPSKR